MLLALIFVLYLLQCFSIFSHYTILLQQNLVRIVLYQYSVSELRTWCNVYYSSSECFRLFGLRTTLAEQRLWPSTMYVDCKNVHLPHACVGFYKCVYYA